MESIPVQTMDEFRKVLSKLNNVTIDLLLFELQEFNHIMFQPQLYVKTQEYDSFYDFELYGENFLNKQFISDSLSEKLVYKRMSDNEIYGFVFCMSSNALKYNELRHSRKNIRYGNLLGVIYAKE